MEAQYSISPLKATVLFLVALFIMIAGGVVTGIVTTIVGSIIYIAMLFPIMIGIAGGYIVKLGVRMARVRDIVRVVILAALVTVTIYGTYNFARYMIFRNEASIELLPKLSKLSTAEKLKAMDVIIDLSLEKETGHTGFLGYMLYRAKRGVSIGRFYSGNGLNLGPIFSWIYWMLEFAIIFWVAMSMGKKTSQTPICESCGSWYGPEEHMGGTSVMNERIVLDLIHRRDFAELGKLLERNASIPSTELYIKRCKRCGKGQSFITVQRASQGTTGRLQLIGVTNLTLQANDSSQLLQYVRVD